MKMKVQGFRELDRALGEFSKVTGVNILRRAAVEALEPMRERAAALAPDDPATTQNDLKDNIAVGTRSRSRRAGRKINQVEAYMGPDADVPFVVSKGVYQEFGTRDHPPQSFMRPAWDGGKMQLIDDVRDRLATQVEKARQRAAKKALKRKG